MTSPLMPKATAVWLIDNTALTFRQIAKFCEIHELEVQAIADGDIAANIVGMSPINNGQLSWEEIRRCEADKTADLVANVLEKNVKERNAKAKKVLSPSQRNDKPAAILWMIKNCPEIIDSQICKLIGTTKPTIKKIRNGEYAGMDELNPKNPVAVGLCNERELEAALAVSQSWNNAEKNAEERAKEKRKKASAKAKAKRAKEKAKEQAKAEKAAAKEEAKRAKEEAKIAAKKAKAAEKAKAKKAAVKAKAAEKAKAKKAAVKAKAAEKEKAKKAAAKAKAAEKEKAKKAAVKAKAAEKAKAKKAADKAKAAEKAKAKKATAKTKKKTATKK